MNLKVDNLSFSYKDKNILKNISFELNDGDFLSILGSNGAGKSTLIKCIMGILKISDGKILVDNENFLKKHLKERAKLIAYVPQFNNISDIKLNVFDTVLLGRLPYKKGHFTQRDKDIALENIHKLELDDFILRYVDELSGGERQRVLIARALTQETNIIMLDEPISNLDMKYQLQTMKLLKKISENENKIILNVIHDINFALNFSNKCLFLKNHEILKFVSHIKEINENVIEKTYDIKARKVIEKDKTFYFPY